MVALATELPDLKSSYPLSFEACVRYRRDGHVMLRGVCSPEEAAAFREPIVSGVARASREGRPLSERRGALGKASAQQTPNLWRADEDVAGFTLARRFARVAAELMGVDAVRIYHDAALFHGTGAGQTPWHQDQYDIPLDTPHVITMWMPIVDVAEEMGLLDFVSASHRDGHMASLATEGAGNNAPYERIVAKRKLPVVQSGAMTAGDATFHAGWTLHRAGPNTSEHVREVMTVTYFADGARVAECDHIQRELDLKAWLPNQKPRELAGTHLNPVVYRRRSFDPAD